MLFCLKEKYVSMSKPLVDAAALHAELSRLHIALQDNRSTDFIDQGFVLSAFLSEAGINHGPMSQYRGETLVVELDGHLWHGLSPSVDELLHALHVLARCAVGLSWFTHNDAFHLLTVHVVAEKVEQL